MKLNLGAGKKSLPGWVNVDIYPGDGIDVALDLSLAPKCYATFPDGAAEEILAKHFIEHLTPLEWVATLPEWHRILAPGGVLTIECPDAMTCAQNFVSDRAGLRWSMWHRALIGDDTSGGLHKQLFTIPRLTGELKAYGFQIRRALPWHDDVNLEDPVFRYNLRVEAVRT